MSLQKPGPVNSETHKWEAKSSSIRKKSQKFMSSPTPHKRVVQLLPGASLRAGHCSWIELVVVVLLLLSLQSCPTLCDPRDGNPSGSIVPGILQIRTLERVAISFSNAWKWKVKVKSLSRVRLLETPWTAAYQASLSMGFSRQEYWSGVPLPTPELVVREQL